MQKKALLIITDGIGKTKQTKFNAFLNAKKPTYDDLFKNTPFSIIKTSGLSVGLPEDQMGNSEVGHMTIGAGRIIYQDLVTINKSINNKSFDENRAFINLCKKSKRIHILGLISDGGIHSHINHIKVAATLAESRGKKVFLHLITDGRDVYYKSAKLYVKALSNLKGSIEIATIGGRFYTMDRDNRWERIALGFNAIVKAKPKTNLSIFQYIDASYAKNETDEFIIPTAFTKFNGLQKGDAILSINYRSDRIREIITALGDKNFKGFKRDFVPYHIATMTEYDKTFSYDVLYKKKLIKNTLSQVVSNAGLSQLHTAETEKYAHVTFFFNTGINEPVKNEHRILIPSPKVKTYNLKPQMSANQVGTTVLTAMQSSYDLIIVNFANADMVGHTGDFDATIIAVESVDKELGRILTKAKELDYSVVLTSDHGNCEEMKTSDGKILTSHTTNNVWCFIQADGITKVKDGGLNNIASTILKLMKLDIPPEMDKPLI